MKIQIKCPGCSSRLTATDKLFGKRVKCPKCSTPINVPHPVKKNSGRSGNEPVRSKSKIPPVKKRSGSATPPAATRTTQSGDQEKGLSRVLILVGLGVLMLLLVAGGVAWMMLAGSSVSKDRKADGIVQEPPGAQPHVAMALPKLRYDLEPQKEYRYDVEFDSNSAEGVLTTTACSISVNPNVQTSSVSTPADKCYANRYGTGLGLPGKRILVGRDVIRKAEKIEIQIGDDVYPARLVPNFKSYNLALLQYDGPDFEPVKVNPFHGYARYPFAIQRDTMARLFMRGRISTSFDAKQGPEDELRFQGIQKSKKPSRYGAPCSFACRSGIMFDRTGTLYGLMNHAEVIFPTARLESLFSDGGLFDESPAPTRKLLSEQELADKVAGNIVSVHAINPAAADNFVRGQLDVNERQMVQSGELRFRCEGFERFSWDDRGRQVEFKKSSGAVPFFLGHCSDLLLVDLTDQGETPWTVDQLVKRNKTDRFNAKSKDWDSASKLVPGSLHEDLKIANYDSQFVEIERRISLKFPAPEKFNMPESWQSKPDDQLSVAALQIVKFDHVRGLILESKTKGTFKYVRDEEPFEEPFEVRAQLSVGPSGAPPQPLRELSDAEAESIVTRLRDGKHAQKKAAIETLMEIQPVEHEGISSAIAAHEPLSTGWTTPFHVLAQRWILPSHVEVFLQKNQPAAEIKWHKIDELLQIIEFKPPVESAKPFIRQALFSPQKREYRIAGRVVRNVYPEMAQEIVVALDEVDGYEDCHGEWIRCLRHVGNAHCIAALERYIEKVASLGTSYHPQHDQYVIFARQAIGDAQQRPVPELERPMASTSKTAVGPEEPGPKEKVWVKDGPRRRTGELQLRKIVLAALDYNDSSNRCFPRNVSDEKGKPLLSWRVGLLPFLGEEILYKKFRLDEPWDSDHNVKLLEEMPEVFRHPDVSSKSKTVFQGFVGGGAMFEKWKDGVKAPEVTFGSLLDGSSNTIFCVEANPDQAVEWTRPADIPFTPEVAVTQVGGIGAESFNVAFCDGAVRALANDFDPKKFAILVGRMDRTPVGFAK